MNEKPILFNTEMVRAILDGRKTMTRRIIKPQPLFIEISDKGSLDGEYPITWFHFDNHTAGKIDYARQKLKFPSKKKLIKEGKWCNRYETNIDGDLEQAGAWSRGEVVSIAPYQVGDKLWVRETFWETGYSFNDCGAESSCNNPTWNWTGGILYEATNPACGKTDGYYRRPSTHMTKDKSRLWLEVTAVKVEKLQDISEDDAKAEGATDYEPKEGRGHRWFFARIWGAINNKRGFGWETNPWVWVYTFKVANHE